MNRTRVLALCILASLVLLPAAARASTSKVVVSQVYGGGGNSGATLTNDFVELFNGSDAAVDVSTWTIQYATAAGTSWQATPLTGTIAPGGYYLVQLASSGSVGSALPAADATGTTNLSGTSGKIALVRDTTALTCGASAGSCSDDPLVEDLVGYGAASDFEGSGSAAALSSTESALRAGGGCTDTDDNATDFAAATPAPRNSASPIQACGGGPPPPATGASGSASVDIDLAPTLSISLDQPALSFGSTAFGETPAPLAENVTVASSSGSGYSLGIQRTAFAPADLPLAISATAPAGGQIGSALAGGALVPIPISPASALEVGTTSAAGTGSGDVWPTQIGFASSLPLVASGHYTATVTYTVVAR